MFKIIEQKLFSCTGKIYIMAAVSINQSNHSPGFLNFQLTDTITNDSKDGFHTAVETPVAKNSPSEDSNQTSVCKVVGSKS